MSYRVLALAVFMFYTAVPFARAADTQQAAAPAAVQPIAQQQPSAEYNCIVCHAEMEDERVKTPVTDWQESAHAQAGVKCADCHGGDPVNVDLAMEPSAGFIGKPKPIDIPKLCAKCHSDTKKMRVHNLRSDQFALYSDSVHGRKALAGDADAPTCVSCHGKHKILKVKDPNSMVARKNIPETCGSCHSKKEIFEKRGQKSNQLEMYKKSRHHELFAKGDLLAPTCFDCHGNHAVQPVNTERTQTVCFTCHTKQAEYYKASKHWDAWQKKGEPVCRHCHSNHDVARPTPAKFTGEGDNDCSACHDEKSPQYATGKQIQQVVMSAVSAAQSAGDSLDEFEKSAHGGFEMGDIREKMDKAREGVKELHTLTHKMDLDALKKKSEALMQVSRMVSDAVSKMRTEVKTRRIGLVAACAILIGFMAMLWLKSRQVDKARDD